MPECRPGLTAPAGENVPDLSGDAEEQPREQVSGQRKRDLQEQAEHERGLKNDPDDGATMNQSLKVLLQRKRERRQRGEPRQTHPGDVRSASSTSLPTPEEQARDKQRHGNSARYRQPVFR